MTRVGPDSPEIRRSLSSERQAAFQAARRRQDVVELKRKADKARRRQNIWTAEELDHIAVEAKILFEGIIWE